MTIAQLAQSVGYESEEAFSRAFKREFGQAPARWRDSAVNGLMPQAHHDRMTIKPVAHVTRAA